MTSKHFLLPRLAWACASFAFNGALLLFQVESSVAKEIDYSKVQLYLDLGKVDQASAFLKQYKDIKGGADYYYYKGRIDSLRSKNKDALNFYLKAVELNPKHEKAFGAMALVRGRMGQFKQALADLDTAIAINPSYAKAYSNRGVTHGAMRNNQAAIADFSMAISIDPRLANAYRNRGITKEMMGDIKGACSDWKIAKSLGQEGPAQWIKAQCK